VTVVGCSGHQSLSAGTRVSVAAAIRVGLAKNLPPLIGVCSLAVGADQIFAQSVLEAGGDLHVIVPSERYEETFSGAALQSYSALLNAAAVTTTLPYREPGADAYLQAGKSVVDACDLLMAVWDGNPAAGAGGTADVVHYARECGRPVVVIWPRGAAR
jgi:hypothetical protein